MFTSNRHLCVVLLAAVAGAQEPPVLARAELLGCWQREGEGKVLMRMEPTRLSLFRDGKLDIYRARYSKDGVMMNVGGIEGEYVFTLHDQVLKLKVGKDVETYRKVAAVSEELVVKPLESAGKEPDAERVRAIQKELAARAVEDQAVRKDARRSKDTGEVDKRNTEWLVQVVKEHGWIDATRFGRTAAGQAFMLVQHSGHLPLMTFALPKIEMDVKAKRADPQDFALLCDRLRLRLGEQQLYGSQIGTSILREQVVLATEDPANVEVRRRELGLKPLADYLQLFKAQNGGKVPAFEAGW